MVQEGGTLTAQEIRGNIDCQHPVETLIAMVVNSTDNNGMQSWRGVYSYLVVVFVASVFFVESRNVLERVGRELCQEYGVPGTEV